MKLALALLAIALVGWTGLPDDFDAAAAWREFELDVRTNYAYIERNDFDVDALLDRARALAEERRTPEGFRRVLRQMSYAFTDGHFVVGPLADDDFNVLMTSSDLVVALRGEDAVVVDVRMGSAADNAGIRPGWLLIEVNGRPIMDAARAALGAVTPTPTGAQLDYAATLVANGKRVGVRRLTFNANGDVNHVSLRSPREFASTVSAMPGVEYGRVRDVGVIKINNTLGDEATITAFDDAVAALGDTTGIVLDLRNTPSGGNTDVARSIIGHFIREERAYQVHEIPAVERTTSVPRRFIELALPRTPHYDGALVVLGGHWTGSMGEGLVIGLHAAAGSHVIASDMSDLLGGLWNFQLDSAGALIDFGGEALFHVDGTPRELFVADTPLPSADRDADGGDPAMTAAWKHLASKSTQRR